MKKRGKSSQNGTGKQKVKSSTHPENSGTQNKLERCAATLTFHQRGLKTANHHSHTQLCPLKF